MPAYRYSRLAAVAAVAFMPLSVHAQQAGSENVVLAVPNVALTFAPGYLAEDLGLFAKQRAQRQERGDRRHRLRQCGDLRQRGFRADIGRDAHARRGTRPASHLAIAGTLDRPTVQIVLRKEIAAAAGFDPKAPLDAACASS